MDLPSADLRVVAAVEGATLAGDLKGHERFGFLDDISQPRLRGIFGYPEQSDPDDPNGKAPEAPGAVNTDCFLLNGSLLIERRRLLRRGIPFTTERDRGLLFACYQTSIKRQFEAIQRAANEPDFKTGGAGHDLISDKPTATIAPAPPKSPLRVKRCP